MPEETTVYYGIERWNDYKGMVFWESAVVYFHQIFNGFDPQKLSVIVDEEHLFSWGVAFSYDKQNWSHPRPLADLTSEEMYQSVADLDLRSVWFSIWVKRLRPEYVTDTLNIKKNTDTTIPILRIGSVSYDGAELDFNDEAVANGEAFFELVNKTPKWNFYDRQQVNIRQWLDRCQSTIGGYGHACVYFKTLPTAESTDNTLSNHTLREVVAIKRLLVISPNNELPSEKQVYTEWDMPLFDDFMLHIVDEHFRETFGQNTVPLQKDYLYIPMLDRIFRVSNVQPSDKRFMGKIGWWECYMAKYEKDSTVSMSSELSKRVSPYDDVNDALDEFKGEFNIIEELERYLDDTVIDEGYFGKSTDDEKKAANSNFSNRLTDSTGYVDLKDTEAQRSAYSTRLNIVTVNPDGNALFPITMYNCGDLDARVVAMTYDLADLTKISGDKLRIRDTFTFGFDFVPLAKFNGELFDLHPAMTVSFTRGMKVSVGFQQNQGKKSYDYVFTVNAYYRLEFVYDKKINQLSIKFYALTNGEKVPVIQDIYIVNGALNTDPFGTMFSTLIMYGGSWLAGNISLCIDTKTIINDTAIPVLVMNKFGL
jgi:hypothetical protein